MSQQLYIPKRCIAGYDYRTDTFNGKLSYVTYFDDKGTHRKKVSWEGFRDPSIPAIEFDNVPTSGWVLHKGVGGVGSGWGWNDRRKKIRVFDPRGNEFEIDIENLLFILAHSNCVNREITDPMVYAWDGKDLVLLPVTSKEYRDAKEYTRLQGQKVSAKDLIKGAIYRSKKQDLFVYLGRFEYYRWIEDKNKRQRRRYASRTPDVQVYNQKMSKKHVFLNIKTKQIAVPSVTGFFSECVQPEMSENYAEYLKIYQDSSYSERLVDIVSEYDPDSSINYRGESLSDYECSEEKKRQRYLTSGNIGNTYANRSVHTLYDEFHNHLNVEIITVSGQDLDTATVNISLRGSWLEKEGDINTLTFKYLPEGRPTSLANKVTDASYTYKQFKELLGTKYFNVKTGVYGSGRKLKWTGTY